MSNHNVYITFLKDDSCFVPVIVNTFSENYDKNANSASFHQRAITQKICNPELRFLCSARRLMLVSNPMKFHHDILNGFRVTERTRLECKFCYFPSKGNNSKNIQSRVTVLVFCMSSHVG